MIRTDFTKLFGCVLAAALLTTGCLNSEGDYKRLTEEKDALAAELETARQENEILSTALENISRERERLQVALGPQTGAVSASTSSGTSTALADVNDADVVALAGDTDPAAPAAGDAAQAAASQAGAQAAPAGGIHVAQRGDTLSNIAMRYNTTLQELLALNPYLQRRNGYMVWENDNIQLPRN